jgi:hypothetical protein
MSSGGVETVVQRDARKSSFTFSSRRLIVPVTYAWVSETASVSGQASGISGPPELWLPYLPKVPMKLLLAPTIFTRNCPRFG